MNKWRAINSELYLNIYFQFNLKYKYWYLYREIIVLMYITILKVNMYIFSLTCLSLTDVAILCLEQRLNRFIPFSLIKLDLSRSKLDCNIDKYETEQCFSLYHQ